MTDAMEPSEAQVSAALQALPVCAGEEGVGCAPIVTSLPAELEWVFSTIVKTGRPPPYLRGDDWPKLRNAIAWKIRLTMWASFSTSGFLGPTSQSFKSRQLDIEQLLLGFEDEAPFTLQRILEILVNEKSCPSATHKRFNSLERCLWVSSTLDLDDLEGEAMDLQKDGGD